MPRALAIFLVFLVCGCGVPQELSKQAEDVHSVAAEGALLARETAEGSSTGAFTRVHAEALRKKLLEVEPAVEDERLSALIDDAAAALSRLASDPDDEQLAADLTQALERTARSASELAS